MRSPTSPGARIAVVTAFPPGRNSLNEYGQHLVTALSTRPGVKEVVVLADEPGAADGAASAARPCPDRAPVRVVPAWRFGSLLNLVRLLRVVRRERPDAVLFNLQFATFGDGKVAGGLGLLAPALIRATGVPTGVLLHNLVDAVDLEDAGYGGSRVTRGIIRAGGRILTRALLLADRVAVTIPAYVDLLVERYGATNVALTPHGTFDVLAAPPPEPVEGPRRILAFGKFGTYKRVEVLVQAYRHLLDRGFDDVELVIAGTDSPNAPGYLASAAQDAADLPGVRFTGYVAEEDVPELFMSSSVVAFPYTTTTGSSGVLHQAGSFGRAVVLPRVGDLVELCEQEGYTGQEFVAGDPESLADALEGLLVDEQRRALMGEQNFLAAQGLSIGDVADWHLLHLDYVAGSRRGVALLG